MAKRNIEGAHKKHIQKLLFMGGMITLAFTIFGAGYAAGKYISDINCSEKTITIIGDYQKKEWENIQRQTSDFKKTEDKYATKEELEIFRKDFNEFVNKK